MRRLDPAARRGSADLALARGIKAAAWKPFDQELRTQLRIGDWVDALPREEWNVGPGDVHLMVEQVSSGGGLSRNVGVGTLELHPSLEPWWHPGTGPEINLATAGNVAVLPGEARRGVGSALMGALFSLAIGQHGGMAIRTFRFRTPDGEDAPAMRFYRGLGFEEIVRPEDIRSDGRVPLHLRLAHYRLDFDGRDIRPAHVDGETGYVVYSQAS